MNRRERSWREVERVVGPGLSQLPTFLRTGLYGLVRAGLPESEIIFAYASTEKHEWGASKGEAQAAIRRLQHLLDQDHECDGMNASIVEAEQFAVARHITSHTEEVWNVEENEKLYTNLYEELSELVIRFQKSSYEGRKHRDHHPAPALVIAFWAFANTATNLAEDVIDWLRDFRQTSNPAAQQLLETFAAKLGESVHPMKDGTPHIGSSVVFICSSGDPKRLVLGVNCINPYVANAVQEMAGNVLCVIPEAQKITREGHTNIGFTFGPENPEAVRLVRQLKDQPGTAVQLPLQTTDATLRVN